MAYDGGGFHGWARQPGLRTVQGEMETALHTVLRVPVDNAEEPLRLTVAGRTDTGVHASHQVCHLDVGERTLERCVGHMEVPAVEALRRRLNHALPDDIALLGVCEAPNGFDARFSALERTYVYRICDGARPKDPRMRGFVLDVEDELDIKAMNEAAAMTIGLHDFGSFATPNPGGTTIREVKSALWRRVPLMGMYGDTFVSHDSSSSCLEGMSGNASVVNGFNASDGAVSDGIASAHSQDEYGKGAAGSDTLSGTEVGHVNDALVSGNAGVSWLESSSANITEVNDSGSRDGVNPSRPQVEYGAESTGRNAALSAEAEQVGYAVPALESGLLCFTIVADAFAHNMVRSLVNGCVQVGRHRKTLDWFAGKMREPVREGSTGPIAARGLTLEHIAYPADDELATRAQAIRARRTLPDQTS